MAARGDEALGRRSPNGIPMRGERERDRASSAVSGQGRPATDCAPLGGSERRVLLLRAWGSDLELAGPDQHLVSRRERCARRSA